MRTIPYDAKKTGPIQHGSFPRGDGLATEEVRSEAELVVVCSLELCAERVR